MRIIEEKNIIISFIPLQKEEECVMTHSSFLLLNLKSFNYHLILIKFNNLPINFNFQVL